MRTIPGRRAFKRGVLLYRKMRYRKGHGVHSPFVFRFITKVIDERGVFYSQNDIELTRKKVFHSNNTFSLPCKKKPGTSRELSAGEILKKIAITPKSGALLTRIANYFKPQTILQIGCAGGVSSLYLSACSSEVNCIVLEENKEMASFCRFVFEKHGAKNVALREGSYEAVLTDLLTELKSIDLIYLDSQNDISLNAYAVDHLLPRLHSGSVLILTGIRSSVEKRKQWEQLRDRPETGVTIDVYEFGIVFFDKKIYKRNYIVSF